MRLLPTKRTEEAVSIAIALQCLQVIDGLVPEAAFAIDNKTQGQDSRTSYLLAQQVPGPLSSRTHVYCDLGAPREPSRKTESPSSANPGDCRWDVVVAFAAGDDTRLPFDFASN